jgi:hypothetical protein
LSALPASFAAGSATEQAPSAWGSLGAEVGAPTIPPNVYYFDNFNRANGAVGSNWTKLGGGNTFSVSSNTLRSSGSTSASALYAYALPFSTLDQKVSAKLRHDSNNDYVGIAVRVKDYSNYVICAVQYSNGSSPSIRIRTVIAGTAVDRATFTGASKGTVPFIFTAVGNVYTVKDIGGTTLASWTDSGGIFAYDSTNNKAAIFIYNVLPVVDDFEMADV